MGADLSPFGTALLSILDVRGLCRTDVVNFTNMDFSRLSRILNGTRKVTAADVHLITDRLRLSTDEHNKLMTAAAASHGFVLRR
jgi:antitoxin component HigA of HigAB toxin-antitoxin module